MASNTPTLPVLVLRRWSGGNLEPGDKGRIPSALALKLAAIGAVKVLSPAQAPAIENVPMQVRTPEDPLALVERVPAVVVPVAAESIAEPAKQPDVQPPRRRRR